MSNENNVPDNANDGCEGIGSANAGKALTCSGCPNQSKCSGNSGPDPAVEKIRERMKNIKHKIIVLSGKGGVGKSTVSSQLAWCLADKGKQVGILDIDICGPSIPRMMGVISGEVHQSGSGWEPVYVSENLSVMSIGFLLPNRDDAVIWRGAKKHGLIQQFLTDINWGNLDYLIIDTPPGTSDEHISIVTFLKEVGLDGAVVVTTPQEVSLQDVRKELNFCTKTNINILGVIENMSELRCEVGDCTFRDLLGNDISKDIKEKIKEKLPELLSINACIDIFPPSNGGTTAMCEKYKIPFLGRIPLEKCVERSSESGSSILEIDHVGTAGSSFVKIIHTIECALSK
ncbi:hypothetical protein WA158_001583 [Blastocystis sp. Blastoise]